MAITKVLAGLNSNGEHCCLGQLNPSVADAKCCIHRLVERGCKGYYKVMDVLAEGEFRFAQPRAHITFSGFHIKRTTVRLVRWRFESFSWHKIVTRGGAVR